MTGWPDPTRPGVPLNPERDGWHWLRRNDSGGVVATVWCWGFGWGEPIEDTHAWTYLGPCLTPSEVQSQLAAARRAALEEAANIVETRCTSAVAIDRARTAVAIRALAEGGSNGV